VWGAKSGGAAAATRFAVLCGTWWLILACAWFCFFLLQMPSRCWWRQALD
jgi:hypothetical protein